MKSKILDPGYHLSMAVPLVKSLKADIKWVYLKLKKDKKYRAESKEWFHYTNEMEKFSEIPSIPKDWLHLEVRGIAESDLTFVGSLTVIC